VGKVATLISVVVLFAVSLVAVRSASLVLEEGKPVVKRRPRGKGVAVNARLIAGSMLETAWAVGVGALAGVSPPLP
jgi:hypothetical protein